jgi:hypothetical protein
VLSRTLYCESSGVPDGSAKIRSNSSTSASWPAVKILPSVDRSIASQLARNASKASKSGFISFTASSSISPSLERNSTKRASIPPNGGKGLLFPSFRRSIEGVRSFALYSLIHAPFALAARSSLYGNFDCVGGGKLEPGTWNLIHVSVTYAVGFAAVVLSKLLPANLLNVLLVLRVRHPQHARRGESLSCETQNGVPSPVKSL